MREIGICADNEPFQEKLHKARSQMSQDQQLLPTEFIDESIQFHLLLIPMSHMQGHDLRQVPS
jgi:hypothetical protein